MPILVDMIMIGLLIGVIIHSTRLSQSLTNFKALHAEIIPMMKDYAKTLTETQSQIQELKKVSQDVDHMINSRIPPALVIKNDLDFLVSRANELANNLENLVMQGRAQEFAVARDMMAAAQKAEDKKIKNEKKNREKINLQASRDYQVNGKENKTSAKDRKPKLESFFSSKAIKKITNKGRTHAA